MQSNLYSFRSGWAHFTRKPKTEPNRKVGFSVVFGSVSVSVVGNFGFGARLRFWCSRNRITEPAIARTRKHRRSHPVVRIEGYQQPKPKAQHGPTVNTHRHTTSA